MAAEIGIACFGAVATKVTEWLCVPIGRQVCFAFSYEKRFDDLKEKVKELKHTRERVQHRVDDARRQCREIEKDVKNWFDKVDELIERMDGLIAEGENRGKKRCFKWLCPNPVTRYFLNKKAVAAVEDFVRRFSEADSWIKRGIDGVSYRPVLVKSHSMYTRGYEEFETRTRVLEEIMGALNDATINMIGVHGMGGVGKTTLAKKVASQAMQDKLFDVVVMVEIKQNPDYKKIQGEIAFQLGLELQDDSESARAATLRERLKGEKRALVILDDIWAKVDLAAIGIPFEGDKKGSVTPQVDVDQGGRIDNKRPCRILLTSRRADVLRNGMNTQHDFSVTKLADEEAETLFWKIVGDTAENNEFKPIAVKIVSKCAGLPVAIETIASALKHKSLAVWKDALQQLRMSKTKNIIPEMDANVYSSIKLSYNYLNSEEAKSLFLLCGLHSIHGNINIEYLLRYGMGLGLFDEVYTLEDGRNRLYTLIDNLMDSCLLMDMKNDYVRMHDVILAVAISLASTNGLMYNIQDAAGAGLKKRLEDLPKDIRALSLSCRNFDELPERLEFPKLKFLLLSREHNPLQITNAYFEGVKDLKVLDVFGMDLSLVPSSICRLMNLQTLCLDECMLGDIATLGGLKKLEILSLLGSDIRELPGEIRQLSQLKLLDLSKCSNLRVIAPNVISSLTQLEELYMVGSGFQWEAEGNASLAELKQLSCLTSLEISVHDAQIMPKDLSFEKLERFKIHIGHLWRRFGEHENSRTLTLKLNNHTYLSQGVKALLKKTEDLYLDEMKGVKNVLYELDDGGFKQLKHLHVRNTPEILYIVNSWESAPCISSFPKLESLFLHNLINLEKVCHGKITAESFSKLKIMEVEECNKLKHLISVSMLRRLLNLQELKVIDCENLKEIVCKESEGHVQENEGSIKIELPRLLSLRLQCLPQLSCFGFNVNMPSISQSSTPTDMGFQEISAEDDLPLFSHNVVLPSLENLTLSSINIECRWLNQFPVISSCCQTLTTLIVERCSGLKFLFSYFVVECMAQLQELEVQYCESIEGIIDTEELRQGNTSKMTFHKLRNLQLKGLPNLTRFGSGSSVEFPSLITVAIEDCPNLKTFFSDSVVECMAQLQVLEIRNCKSMEEIIDTEELRQGNTSKMTFHKLRNLQLKGLPNLTRFGSGSSVEFPSLITVAIKDCPNLKTFFSDSVVADMVVSKEQEEISLEQCGAGVHSFFDVKVKLPTLASLHLSSLGIHTIWHNQQHAISCFQNLTKLTFVNCDHLKYLLSLSTIESFAQLTFLKISHCKSMVRVIDIDEGRISNTLFPKLKRLILEYLPQLRTFCCFTGHSVQLSSLATLAIRHCPKMQTFASDSCADTRDMEDPDEVNIKENFHSFFGEKVKLPTLASLRLSSLGIHTIWHNQQHAISCFQNLTKLTFVDCDHLKYLLSSSTIESFAQLTFLKISYCKSMVRVIDIDEGRISNTLFPKLKGLILEYLPQLRTFCCFTGHSVQLSSLATLTIGHCPKMQTFASDSCADRRDMEDPDEVNIEKNFHSFFGEKVKLPTLASIRLSSLGIHTIWHNQQHAISCFQNLTELTIVDCDHLKYLLSLSTIESFAQLTFLKISHCKSMVRVIDIDEGRISNTLFPKLKGLILEYLSQLRTFCCFTGHSVQLSSLAKLTIGHCPKMQTFASDSCANTKDMEDPDEVNIEENFHSFFDEKIELPTLASLRLSSVSIHTMWHNQQHAISCFQNLTELTFVDCVHLKYLLSSSTIESFVQLTFLKISNCKSMVRVIDINEGQISNTLFPKLKGLILEDLPQLRTFCCFTGHSVQLPSLPALSIECCPKMQTFASDSYADMKDMEDPDEINIKENFRSFFGEKVELPILASLRLSSVGIHTMWHNQQQAISCFQNLRKLTFVDCDHLKYLLSSSTIESFVQLTFLKISNCKSMVRVIDIDEGRISNTLFPKLNELILEDLPQLRTFCCFTRHSIQLSSLAALKIGCCPKMQTFASDSCADTRDMEDPDEVNIEESFHSFFGEKVELPTLVSLCLSSIGIHTMWHNQQHSISCFQNLTELTFVDCDHLKYLLSSSTIESFVHLTFLKISNCKSMVRVIDIDEGRISNTLFPKLKGLILEDIPTLRTFCCFTGHSVRLSSLAVLTIGCCPKMQTFASDSCADTRDLEDPDEVNIEDNFHSFFGEKVELPTLTSLRLSSVGIHTMWHNQQHAISCFQNLTELTFVDCDHLKYLLSSSTIESFVQLTFLKISNCKSMVKVIDIDEGRIHNTLFPKLNELILEDLPQLRTFCCFTGHSIQLSSLAQLTIGHCPKMQTFASDSCADTRDVEDPGEVNIEENFHSFFAEKVELPTLASLGLSSVGIHTMWHNQQHAISCFQNLTKLTFVDCDHLKYLLSSSTIESFVQLTFLKISNCKSMVRVIDIDEGRISNTLFPKLKGLILEDLPQLRTFCCFTGHSVQLPSLAALSIDCCPKIQTFASDSCADTKNMEDPDEINIEENFHSFFGEKVELPTLTSLRLSSVGIHTMWRNQQHAISCFQNLTELTFVDCDHLKYLLSSSTVESFVQVTFLKISNCKSMVRVIDIDEGRIHNTLFPKLNELILEDLPQLRTFCSFTGHSVQLSSLAELTIGHCPKMQTFASDSCADTRDMEDLDKVNIEGNFHSFFGEKVELPTLASLGLSSVGIHTMWHNQQHAISCFQNLTELTFVDCDHLKYLLSSSTIESFVQLTFLKISNCKSMVRVIDIDEGRISNTLFPKLKGLILEDLPQLRTFCCFTRHSVQLPSLAALSIDCCPKMQTFASDSCAATKDMEDPNEINIKENFHSFFGEKVELPTLASLCLSSVGIHTMWHNQQHAISCFQNLTKLTFVDCDHLKYLLSSSTIESFVQLTFLKISNCKSMIRVIDIDEGRINNTLFPKLNELILEDLPQLKTFCCFTGHSIQLSSLAALIIGRCPKMQTFASDSCADTRDMEDPDEVNIEENFHSFFGEKVELPTLASLRLFSVGIHTMWHNQQHAISCFQNLTELTFVDCDHLKYLLSSSTIESFVQLTFLKISNCNSMVKVIDIDEVRISNTLFPKLNELILEDLPQLRTFCCFTGHSVQLSSLAKLTIGCCPKMQTFASDSCAYMRDMEDPNGVNIEENFHSFFGEKVAFPCLNVLTLSQLPELLHLWKGSCEPSKVFENLERLSIADCHKLKVLVPSSVSLRNLITLEVEKCDELINLVTFSTAKSLAQLRMMEINDCKMIEAIIMDMGDELKDGIVFNQLEYLRLRRLPSLTSFSIGNFTIEFPYLQRVLLIECLKMMNFSQGVVSTPMLQRLVLKEHHNKWRRKFLEQYESEEDEGYWEGDLNTTIRKHFKDKNGESSERN